MPNSSEASSSIVGRFWLLSSGWNKDVVERRRRDLGGSGASESLSLSLDDMV